jgi:hypothetical protein
MSFLPIKKLGIILAAIVTAGAAGAAVVTAGIPSAGGTISACYKINGGDLRVIDAEANAACKNTESPISWPSQASSGGSGVQSAYAFLNPDATLNTQFSKNISGIHRINITADKYIVCFDIPFTPKWMKYDKSTSSFDPVGTAFVRGEPYGANNIDNLCGPQFEAIVTDVAPFYDQWKFAFFD